MHSILRLVQTVFGHYLGSRPPFVLYLAHIPKTGGTTVDSLLRQRINGWRCSPLIGVTDMLRLPPARLDGFDFISGHLEFGYHLGSLVSRPVRPLVFLRDPRALLLSMYKQLWKDRADPLRAHVEKNCPGLEAFFHDRVASAYVANSQVRYLALAERRLGPADIAAIRAAQSPGQVGQVVREANERERELRPEHLLARAIKRLRECWFVGISEQMEESMNALASRLGWGPFGPTPRLNESPDRRHWAELPAGLRRRLNELTVLDRVLYDEAARLAAGDAAQRAA